MLIPESIALIYSHTLVIWEYGYDDNYCYIIQRNLKIKEDTVTVVSIAKTKMQAGWMDEIKKAKKREIIST